MSPSTDRACTRLARRLGGWKGAGIVWAASIVVLHLAVRDVRVPELLYLPPLPWPGPAPGASAELRTLGDLAALFAAAIVPCLAYLALGWWILRGLRFRADPCERIAVAFVLGSGGASLAILALRAMDVPVPIAALALVAATPAFLRAQGPTRGTSAPSPTAPRWSRWLDGATLTAGSVLFVAALGPETSWDALEYHLPIVRAWSEGPIRALPAVLDAELRLGVDLLFLPAVAAGHPDAAAAVSAAFALALVALIRGEVRRRASPAAGACAGLLALLAPIVLENAPVCFVDLGVGAYGFVAILFADRWNRSGDPRALLVSALALGFAANAKLHAGVLVPAVLVLVALGGRIPSTRAIVRLALIATLLVAPWFAKAALTTGNPFFPLLGEWFGYGPFEVANIEGRAWRLTYDLPVERTLTGLLAYLAAVNFGGPAFVGGLIGPLPLAFGPLALGRMSRPTLVLGATLAVLVVLQAWYAPALRFGLPVLPFVAIAAGVGGARLARSGRLARSIVAVACGGIALLFAASMLRAYVPRAVALRAPSAYERAVFPAQANLREIVAVAEPVVGIRMAAVLWMPKPVYLLHWERNGEIFFLRSPPREVLAVLRRRGVRSLVMSLPSPLLRDASTGERTLDLWLRAGIAVIDTEVEPTPAGEGRVWTLIHLR